MSERPSLSKDFLAGEKNVADILIKEPIKSSKKLTADWLRRSETLQAANDKE